MLLKPLSELIGIAWRNKITLQERNKTEANLPKIRRNGEVRYQIERMQTSEKESRDNLTKVLTSTCKSLVHNFEIKSGLAYGSGLIWYISYQIPEEDTLPKVAQAKIVLLNRAEDSNKIIGDDHYKLYEFGIIEGANSTGGANRETERFNYSLSENHGQTWESYENFVKEFQEKFREKNIKKVRGELVDYVMLAGIDPASKQTIFIEMGKLPEVKPSMLRRMLPKEIRRTQFDLKI